MKFEVNENRLAEVSSLSLSSGGHVGIAQGMCVMEAVSYVAGEPWSDTPACACPVIASFLRSWNDSLPDDKRTDLLRPVIARLVGTKSTPAIEARRATMACDWLVRMYTPAWLRLAGLTAQADALAGLPEIVDFANTPSIKPAIEAARRDAAAAWDAAWDAAGHAAREAARNVAGAAAWEAAGPAAWDAARNAAGAAAWDAAGAKLAPTVNELQASALVLVGRMIEVRASEQEAAMQAERERQAAEQRKLDEQAAQHNALADYYDDSTTVFRCDGSDLLAEFTAALADAAHLIDAIAHGDPLPDSDLQAFRALCRQSKVAVERQQAAIDEAVFVEMSR